MVSQDQKSRNKLFLVIGIFIAVSLIAFVASPEGVDPKKVGPWYSILPPLLAVCAAAFTGKIIWSLLAAVVGGGILSTIYTGEAGLQTTGITYISSALTDEINVQILGFVVLVMAMIAVLIASGGLHAVIEVLMKRSQSAQSSQILTAILGLLIFIDDYANTMIVGSSMRPVTDRFKVSREKLAFLVDATAAPIAGIAIVSTWIGYQVGLFADVSKSLSLGLDGYAMFFDSLGFRFYCFLMIVFVFANVLTGRDFGPMKEAETRARRTGKLSSDRASKMASSGFSALEPEGSAEHRVVMAAIPFAILFAVLIGGMWLDGGGGEKGFAALFSVTTWREVFSSSENGTMVLAAAAGAGLLASILLAPLIAKLPPNLIGKAVLTGAKSSVLPMTILVLAWSLKGVCDALNTDSYLVETVGQSVSPLAFPIILFILSALTAFSTGTSWGTMAILIPTAIPVAYSLDGSAYGLVTIICLGAVLDGAILGDHCSPISDTTIMSSISSSCDHLDHVKTQFPYALLVGAIALLFGYLPAALGLSPWLCIFIGAALIVTFFLFLRAKSDPIEA